MSYFPFLCHYRNRKFSNNCRVVCSDMLSASSPHTPHRRECLKAMDVYQEAVDYLLSQQIPVEVNTGSNMLEEDVFSEDSVACLLSPLQTGSFNFPDSPTLRSPEELLEKRLEVLKRILESEELYLNELDILLMPLKALRASAGTSQPVLSSQDVQTVFYQVPELRDLHQCFYEGLRARLEAHTHTEPGPGPGSTTHSDMGPPEKNSWPGRETGSGDGFRVGHGGFELTVGDLYLKMVSQICVYRGFIDNYEKAVEIVRNCTKCDARFRILAQSMMSKNGRDKVKLKYTFEALLYKPLEKITKTTLVLHELLKTTPEEHNDYPLLQEVLRLSHGFLSGVNEGSQCKREVTLRRGMRRQLMRDGFVVDECEGVRNLRHLFLYTDLLLCAKLKAAAKGKHSQYRFCWYMPLANLRVNWRTDPRRPPDTQLRLLGIRSKMHLLRQQLRPHTGGGSKRVRQLDRSRKKLEQMELLLLTHSPVHRLDLHSPSGKSHSFLLSSLYELEEWRETIHKLTRDNVEMIPPDLLTLTNSCVKLRMTQQPPLNSSNTGSDEQTLCGTLTVAIHSAYGLQQPACVYVCVEVDGYDFYEREAQTHSSAVQSLRPCWNQDFSFQVDGAQNLRLVCVRQAESGEGGEDMILGKASVKLQATDLSKRWRKQTLSLGQVEVMVSLKFCPHPLESPSSTPTQQLPVFSVPVEVVAHQEGVLVPHVVRWCAEEVERRGMEEVGIYRLSGAATDIITLKTAFDSNLRDAVSRLRGAEVNAVSGVLKLYFRELPEPLIPAALFQSLATALDIQDEDSRLDSMLCLLRSCPPVNRHTFLYLMHHLQRISTKAAVNKMSLMNLGTVFGPSLVRPPVVSLGHCGPVMDISQEVVLQARVVQFFLECKCLPAAQTSLLHNTDSEDEDETTHL